MWVVGFVEPPRRCRNCLIDRLNMMLQGVPGSFARIALPSAATRSVCLLHAGDKRPDKNKKPPQQPVHYFAPSALSLHAGAYPCKPCHEEIYEGFARTTHWVATLDAKLDAHKGVEW